MTSANQAFGSPARVVRLLAGRHPFRAAVGAAVGIAACGALHLLPFPGLRELALAAPLGASAVLAFAVTASPLAQPRAIVSGNLVSALAGLAIAAAVSSPALAGPLAVALAILAMQASRSLHPPGGAVALLSVTGGHAQTVAAAGLWLATIGFGSMVLVGAALVFNNLTGSRYPHRPELAPPPATTGPFAFARADLEAVLDRLENLPDIGIDDLEAILAAALAHHVAERK